MVKLGNFLFHYRNGLFPLAYLLLLWPSPRLFNSDLAAAGVGLALAGLGQILRALAVGLVYIIRGGRDRRVYANTLVTTGMFSHCRNPLYVGNFMIIIGLGFMANSRLFLAVAGPLFLIAYLAIVAAEENYLRQKFGAQFDSYCADVNRFVPSFAGIGNTLKSTQFHWRRLLVKEYGSAFAWMGGAVLLLLKNYWLRNGFTAWNAEVGLFYGLLGAVILLYAGTRYLKKKKIVEGD